MSWDYLDIVIVAAILFFAFSGFRRGISWIGPSMIGMLAGLLIGSVVAPPLAQAITHHSSQQSFVVTLIFLTIVFLSQGLGAAVGFQARLASLGTRFARWDSVLGSVLSGAATVAAAWYLGLTFSQSPWVALNQQIASSRLERVMTEVAPTLPSFLQKFSQTLRNNDFPNPFAGLSPEALPPVPIPALADTAGVRTAVSSTYKVVAYGCGGAEAGSSWPLGGDEFATNAHVVAGSERVTVISTDGVTHAATVVLYDPNIDVAVLRVDGVHVAALPRASASDDPQRGTTGAVIGYPGGGDEKAVAAAIRGSETARGYNIYNDNLVTRDIVVIEAPIIPGNSGGPMVDTNGVVQGMVFAASTTDNNEGYALSIPQISGDLSLAASARQGVSTGSCTSQ